MTEQPNDGLREQLAAALDAADQVGLVLTRVSGSAWRGDCHTVEMHGAATSGGVRVSYADAMQVAALAVGPPGASAPVVSDVVTVPGVAPHVRVTAARAVGAVWVIYADPSPEQLVDATVTAALQS